MKSRREFLQLAGMGLLTPAIPKFLHSSLGSSKHKLGLQLYTLRDDIAKNFEGSLKRVAGLGFKYVETAFWPKGISVQSAADTLNGLGLQVVSCHVDIPTSDNIEALVSTAKAYNCKKLIWHGWPQDKRYSSLEGTRELVKIYNESNRLVRDHGLSFGLHNHWWEYRNQVGGKPVYEILNEELNEDLFFETDIYWVKVGGQEPATVLKKLSNRIRLIHVKDGPAEFNDRLGTDNMDPMTPVGKGSLNIPAIVSAPVPKM